MDLLLDSSGDLAIVNGDLVLTSGLAEMRQLLEVSLRFARGQWFLNRNEGFPYMPYILGQKNPKLEVIRGLFREAILKVPLITSIERLALSHDDATRQLTLTFAVKTTITDEIIEYPDMIFPL